MSCGKQTKAFGTVGRSSSMAFLVTREPIHPIGRQSADRDNRNCGNYELLRQLKPIIMTIGPVGAIVSLLKKLAEKEKRAQFDEYCGPSK